jgi:plasmid replication initiation protein
MELSFDDKLRLYEGREYLVVKSNIIVQKSRYVLTVPEQRAVAYICSMIKPITPEAKAKQSRYCPDSPWQLEYDFEIRDYARICGIDYDNGKNYEDVKSTLKRLSDRSMWIDDGNGGEVLVRWLSKVNTNKRSGKARIRLDEDMAPFLFDLQEKFLSYGLKNILAMKSQYSIRLYEILRSYAYQKSKIFEIDELKRLLMVENVKSYGNFKDFRTNVLEIAQGEINELTDITVSFEPILKGRKTVKVKFDMKLKDTWTAGSCAAEADKKLGKIG